MGRKGCLAHRSATLACLAGMHAKMERDAEYRTHIISLFPATFKQIDRDKRP